MNLLHADNLMEAPKLYATFLLWLLTELFRALPEAGDLAKPKLVFFFDEAHLLFANAPAALLQQIERLVRLVHTKGVGVYFATPIPGRYSRHDPAQLGNRVRHALRAYTPKDQRTINAAANAFRPNKTVNVKAEITSMAVGEAFVSVLEIGWRAVAGGEDQDIPSGWPDRPDFEARARHATAGLADLRTLFEARGRARPPPGVCGSHARRTGPAADRLVG